MAAFNMLLMHPDIAGIHRQIKARSISTKQPQTNFLQTRKDIEKVALPVGLNTLSTILPLPVMSQLALPSLPTLENYALWASVLDVSNRPQQLQS